MITQVPYVVTCVFNQGRTTAFWYLDFFTMESLKHKIDYYQIVFLINHNILVACFLLYVNSYSRYNAGLQIKNLDGCTYTTKSNNRLFINSFRPLNTGQV